MIFYNNNAVAQVYYGDKRIREIFLGKKKLMGSPIRFSFDDVSLQRGWLTAGGFLFRYNETNTPNYTLVEKGAWGVFPYQTSTLVNKTYAVIIDGNLYLTVSGGDTLSSYDLKERNWCSLWERRTEVIHEDHLPVLLGMDSHGFLKVFQKDVPADEIFVPSVRFRKPFLTVDDEWCGIGMNRYEGTSPHRYDFYAWIKRSNVIAFSGNTYLNKQGEVRIYASAGDASGERIVTTLSGTDIKFASDTIFLHDGYIYTISGDSCSKSEVGGFSDVSTDMVGYTAIGIRDGKLCTPDGSVITGSPDNVIELGAYGFALTSDLKLCRVSDGIVETVDLKEFTNA